MASPRLLVAALGALCLIGSGCHTGSANTMAGAASMTTLAVGAAAVSKASGGCIAICTNGTACNPKSGLCDPLPCRGECGSDEHCEQNFTGSKCVAGSIGVAASAPRQSGTVPLAPAPAVPDSSGPPVVIPAAEQHPPTAGDTK